MVTVAGRVDPAQPTAVGRATQTFAAGDRHAPGVRPTGMVATTRPAAGSIRTTENPERLETQTAPAPTARPDGVRPTRMVATARWSPGRSA